MHVGPFQRKDIPIQPTRSAKSTLEINGDNIDHLYILFYVDGGKVR